MASWRRLFGTALLAATAGGYNLYQNRPLIGMGSTGDAVRVFGAFSYYGAEVFVGIAPLVAGIAAAGSLAADRSLRYPALVMVRGVSRRQFVLAKATAMAVTAGLTTLMSCGLLLIFAALLFPWGSTELIGNYDVQPFPELFVEHPLLNDLVTAMALSLGAASLALSGLIVGALFANEYVAAAAPFLSVIVGGYMAGGGIAAIFSPYTYLDLQVTYSSVLPPSMLLFAAPLYWSAFAIVSLALGSFIFSRRELC